MGGLGMVLAGGLQGLGSGITQEGKNRFEMALENLRSQNQRQEATHTADLSDRNAGREAVRDDWRDSRGVARRTDSSVTVAKTEGDIRRTIGAEEDARQFGHAERMARVQSDLRLREDSASRRLADELGRDDVADILIDDGGNYVKVLRDGKMIRTSVRATDREVYGSDSSSSSVLEQARGGAPAASAAPARSSAPSPKRPQASSGKTYSQADVVEAAKQTGLSHTEIHKRMREAGYKLAGQ